MKFVVLFALLLSAALAAPVCFPAGHPNVTAALSQMPFCLPYVTSSQVWVDSANQLSSLVYLTLRIYGTLDLDTHTGPTKACLDSLVQAVCTRTFPSCVEVTTASGVIPVYSQPCSQICDAIDAGCRAGYSGLLAGGFNLSAPVVDAILPSCTSTNAPSASYIGGQPLYGPLLWNIPGSPTSMPCVARPTVPQNSSTWPCFGPFQTATNRYNSPPDCGYCEFICPPLLNTQLDKMSIMFQVTAWTSGVVMLVLMPLRLTVPKFSVYPASLVIWSCLMLCIVILGDRMDTYYGFRNVVCPNGVPANGSNAPICSGMGAVGAWGVLAWVFSWTVVAVHCFISVAFPGKKLFNTATMWFSYALSFFGAAICVIGVLARRQFGMFPFIPLCLPINKWDLIGWEMIPLGVALLIGIGCIGFVIYKFSTASSDSSMSLRANLRMLLFLVLVAIWVLAFYILVFYGLDKSDALSASFGEFVGCSFVQDNCSRGFVFNESYIWFMAFWIANLGWIQVALFGTNIELFTDWSNRQSVWKGFKMMFSGPDALDSATATTGGGSSSSSGSSGESTFMSDLQ